MSQACDGISGLSVHDKEKLVRFLFLSLLQLHLAPSSSSMLALPLLLSAASLAIAAPS